MFLGELQTQTFPERVYPFPQDEQMFNPLQEAQFGIEHCVQTPDIFEYPSRH
jgi:hypothetical protein